MNITLKLRKGDLVIPLPEGASADPRLLDGGHPLYYCIKMPGQTVAYLDCVSELLEVVPQGRSVLELCGGIGLIATMMRPIIEPASWTAVELDKNCQESFLAKDWAHFVLADMYAPRDYSKYGLVICEFPTNTLPKMWREPKRKRLLSDIAAARPPYWYIADVGSYWCHLENHRPAYMEYFADKPTKDNYHEYFDKYMRETYKYQVTRHRRGGGASYFLLEPM